jgi:methylphosphotriester-DNA--protein-cysteine methyltransferase
VLTGSRFVNAAGTQGAKPILEHDDLTDAEVFSKIRRGEITLAGHRPRRVYGRLDCRSGRRRMKRTNRVFFASEAGAIQAGYRPCSVCMPHAYRLWKAALANVNDPAGR